MTAEISVPSGPQRKESSASHNSVYVSASRALTLNFCYLLLLILHFRFLTLNLQHLWDTVCLTWVWLEMNHADRLCLLLAVVYVKSSGRKLERDRYSSFSDENLSYTVTFSSTLIIWSVSHFWPLENRHTFLPQAFTEFPDKTLLFCLLVFFCMNTQILLPVNRTDARHSDIETALST